MKYFFSNCLLLLFLTTFADVPSFIHERFLPIVAYLAHYSFLQFSSKRKGKNSSYGSITGSVRRGYSQCIAHSVMHATDTSTTNVISVLKFVSILVLILEILITFV